MDRYIATIFVVWAISVYANILYTRYKVPPHGAFCTLVCKNFNGEYPPNKEWECWHECEIESILRNNR